MRELENKFIKIQEAYIDRIDLQTKFDVSAIQYIAGIDLAYFSYKGQEYATCNIVIVQYKTLQIVEEVEHIDKISIPYIPGFLAFRELPLILETVKKLEIEPDIYMFDGNGYLHQRHMGIATHASFYIKKPTIGVAKKYLKIQGYDCILPENYIGSFTDIIINNNIYGRCLRTRKDVKPVYISCGNWIDLDTATLIVMNTIKDDSRLPIPTRMADLATHKSRKEFMEKITD